AVGSSAAACRKERSASTAQKECICATPWLKNSCAFSLVVVMGKVTRPWPVMIRAGSDGAVPVGGGAQRSLGLVSAANKMIGNNATALLNRIRLTPDFNF